MGIERARLVVLISGTGTTLQALLDAASDNDYPAEIVAVGTDRADAPGLVRATTAGVDTFVVAPEGLTRPQWDQALSEAIASYKPDLVVCAGFMRLLGEHVLNQTGDKIINTHPALLPSFPGAHAVRDALAYGVKVTGCTIHIVDAGVDSGPVLAQESVVVYEDDDEESLHSRIKVVEQRLLPEVVSSLSRNDFVVSGRKVTIQ